MDWRHGIDPNRHGIDPNRHGIDPNRSGGTGLLAKGRITKVLLTSGWIVSTILALFASVEMVLIFQYHWLLLLGLSAALFLGLEYSLPPFDFRN